jgi:hypothetical protein
LEPRSLLGKRLRHLFYGTYKSYADSCSSSTPGVGRIGVWRLWDHFSEAAAPSRSERVSGKGVPTVETPHGVNPGGRLYSGTERNRRHPLTPGHMPRPLRGALLQRLGKHSAPGLVRRPRPRGGWGMPAVVSPVSLVLWPTHGAGLDSEFGGSPASGVDRPVAAVDWPVSGIDWPEPARGWPVSAEVWPVPARGRPTSARGWPVPARGWPLPASGLQTSASGWPEPARGWPAPASRRPVPANRLRGGFSGRRRGAGANFKGRVRAPRPPHPVA